MSTRSVRRAMAAGLVAPVAVLGLALSTTPAVAATLDPAAVKALDLDATYVDSAELVGDAKGVSVLTKSLYGLPSTGNSALVLSTGNAALLANPTAAAKQPKTKNGDTVGVDLAGNGSVDGNDLTQLQLTLNPPYGEKGCLAFDFMFFSEEYPNFVGKRFNDIFTAELNRSEFTRQGNQVVAPNNFAYTSDREVLSVNTFSKFVAAPAAGLNGRSDKYSAVTKVEWPDAEHTPTMKLFLTIQDLGDSKLDSAVVIDNLRFFLADDCAKGIVAIVDTDGDGLPDDWETKGVDYDGDGKPELDLPAMGADPKHKDIFVETDWMYDEQNCTKSGLVCDSNSNSNKHPRAEALDLVMQAFADAPVKNVDGSTGINIHIDAGPESIMNKATGATWGQLSKGNAVPFAEQLGSFTDKARKIYSWSDFDAIRAKNFDLTRGDVFHYVVCANQQGDGLDSSGRSRGLPASDFFLTDATFGVGRSAKKGRFSIQNEAATLMHELGHNLHLSHGGDDPDPTVDERPGFYSIMTYTYQFPGVDGKGKIDYSNGTTDYHLGKATLVRFDDWNHLVYTGGSIGSLGAGSPPPATTQDEELPIARARAEGLFAPGDGAVTLVGPTLVAKDTADQVLIADVQNYSAVAATYTVELDSGWGTSTQFQVAAQSVSRVRIPITPPATGKNIAVTARLLKDGNLISASQLPINSVDLSDADTAAAVAQTMTELAQQPPAGLDPDVVKIIDTVIAPQVTPAKVQEAQQAAQTSNLLMIIGIGVGALVLIGIVATVLVRRRRRTTRI